MCVRESFFDNLAMLWAAAMANPAAWNSALWLAAQHDDLYCQPLAC